MAHPLLKDILLLVHLLRIQQSNLIIVSQFRKAVTNNIGSVYRIMVNISNDSNGHSRNSSYASESHERCMRGIKGHIGKLGKLKVIK